MYMVYYTVKKITLCVLKTQVLIPKILSYGLRPK